MIRRIPLGVELHVTGTLNVVWGQQYFHDFRTGDSWYSKPKKNYMGNLTVVATVKSRTVPLENTHKCRAPNTVKDPENGPGSAGKPEPPRPGTRTECVPGKTLKKAREAVDGTFGLNQLVIPVPENVQSVTFAAAPADPAFGTDAVALTVVADENLAAGSDARVVTKKAEPSAEGDRPSSVVVDLSRGLTSDLSNMVLVRTRSRREDKSSQNTWYEPKFVRAESKSPQESRAGLTGIRNPYDAGTQPVEMNTYQAPTGDYESALLALDLDSAGTTSVRSIDVNANLQKLGSFHGDFVATRDDGSSVRFGTLRFDNDGAYKTFSRAKPEDLKLVLHNLDGTSSTIPMIELAPQGLRAGPATPQIAASKSVAKPNELIDITVMGDPAQVERTQGRLLGVLDKIAWQTDVSGGKTEFVRSREPVAKGQGRAPGAGQVFRAEATYELIKARYAQILEAARKNLDAVAPTIGALKGLLPRVEP